jgi:hypothetical protein
MLKPHSLPLPADEQQPAKRKRRLLEAEGKVADRGGRWLMTRGAESLGLLRADEGEAMRQEASARGDPPLGAHQIERWLAPGAGGGDDPDRHRGGAG